MSITLNHNVFQNDINMAFKKIHEWFNTNLVWLKNHFVQFLTKNNSFNEWIIEHSNKLITNTCSLTFWHQNYFFNFSTPCI
jgi:hypothetical protein